MNTSTQLNGSRRIRTSMKHILFSLPFGRTAINYFRYQRAAWRLKNSHGSDDVFTKHFQSNFWESDESISGPGSTLAYTAALRKSLPELLKRYHVQRFLDAPCGDFNWGRVVEWGQGVQYLGGDIVAELAARNQELFGNETRSFRQLNIVEDPLPAADMWLCRDCLFHLSNQLIWKALANFAGSAIPYILTTCHPVDDANWDIPVGAFRPLNLRIAPFHFPEPLETLEDTIPGYPKRYLGLWSQAQIRDVLKANGKEWNQPSVGTANASV